MDNTNTTQPWELQRGMDVIAADGDKIGEVEDARGQYIVVKKGFLIPSDYYIPADRISTVDDSGVHLSMTKDQALDEQWRQPPADTTVTPERGTSAGTVPTGTDDFDSASYGGPVGAGTATDLSPEERSRSGRTGGAGQTASASTDQMGTADDTDTFRVPIVEEELTATRHPVDRGTVRIEKDVVEEERSIDVPVTEEEVHVTPRSAATDDVPADYAIHDDTIEVPVQGEEVEVQKQPHVTGELEVTKRPVKKTRHVQDTVRREEAHLADDSGVIDTDQRLDTEGNQPG